MVAKNVYPVKMKFLLLYNDLTWSGVDILRNVEKSIGRHLKLTLYILNIYTMRFLYWVTSFLFLIQPAHHILHVSQKLFVKFHYGLHPNAKQTNLYSNTLIRPNIPIDQIVAESMLIKNQKMNDEYKLQY
jgi:hypothetical protein